MPNDIIVIIKTYFIRYNI